MKIEKEKPSQISNNINKTILNGGTTKGEFIDSNSKQMPIESYSSSDQEENDNDVSNNNSLTLVNAVKNAKMNHNEINDNEEDFKSYDDFDDDEDADDDDQRFGQKNNDDNDSESFYDAIDQK
jgi:hypothetical protein